MRYTVPVVVLTLVVAASAVYWRTSHASEPARDKVDELMPRVMSDDDKVRAEAERQVFALDQAGRDELDRIARGTDTRRAIAALRLLARRTWSDDMKTHGSEQAAVPSAAAAPTAVLGVRSGDAPAEQIRDEIAELRRRIDEFDRGFPLDARLDWPEGPNVRAKAGGEFVDNDRRLTWSIAEDGSVKVTTRDGKDAAEKAYEARSLADLRAKEPDVAKRLEDALPRAERGLFVRVAPPGADDFLGRSGPGAPTGDARVRSDVAPPVLGIEWSPPSPALCDQLDIPAGMVVQSVVAGTPAEKLGLERHDVLVELNGKTVAASADIRAALDPVKSGGKLAAVVVRKGRRQTLAAVR